MSRSKKLVKMLYCRRSPATGVLVHTGINRIRNTPNYSKNTGITALTGMTVLELLLLEAAAAALLVLFEITESR
jgi:hypothetical protein